MYSLHILTGPWKGKRLTVREASLTIGRGAECALQPPDDEISRQHAVIEVRPDGVYARDLGSLNGFLFNSQPVREVKLINGAVLEFGRTQMQFHLLTPPAGVRRRRIGGLQALTAILVTATLLVQFLFLAALSMRSQNLLGVVERSMAPLAMGPAAAPAPPVTPSAPPSAETNPPPAPETAPPETPLSPEEPVPPADSVSNELAQLRAEMEALREQMAAPDTNAAPAALAETTATPEPTPTRVEDPLAARAQGMLDEALLEIQRSNLLQADHLLERIQIMAPEFLPAYVERAKLYEQRGMLLQSGEQWAEVLRRSIGTPLYEQAAAERIRVARAEMLRPPPSTPAQRRDAAELGPRLPRRIRIASVEQEKLPVSDTYEEMRLVRVALRPVASERLVEADEIQVAVYFFDEDRNTGEVAPTQAVTQKQLLRVEGAWVPGTTRTVTGTYLVPAGGRAAEEKKSGRRLRYYGYAVRVYYREDLQDEAARPKDLREKVRALPSPFHAAPRPATPVSPAAPPASPPSAPMPPPAPATPPPPTPADESDFNAPVGR